ncbi:MAG TPA: hypothetical protein VHA56_16150 [Mucilaginibacter sp.]|nr:hypothetical protein [Mucilaginibacter sp.]
MIEHREQQALPPAMRYGIKIISSRLFKGKIAKQGHFFMIASFSVKGLKTVSGYQISFEAVREHSERAMKDVVIDKVVKQYFNG